MPQWFFLSLKIIFLLGLMALGRYRMDQSGRQRLEALTHRQITRPDSAKEVKEFTALQQEERGKP